MKLPKCLEDCAYSDQSISTMANILATAINFHIRNLIAKTTGDLQVDTAESFSRLDVSAMRFAAAILKEIPDRQEDMNMMEKAEYERQKRREDFRNTACLTFAISTAGYLSNQKNPGICQGTLRSIVIRETKDFMESLDAVKDF